MTGATRPAGELWQWAVAIYADSDVAEQCLRLQDEHGQCVPLLLWAAWAGGRQRAVPPDSARAASAISRAWNTNVVVPLRDMRRRLKIAVDAMDDERRLAIRERIKGLELLAERQLLEELAALPLDPPARCPDDPLVSALLIVAAQWSDEVPTTGLITLAEQIGRQDNGSIDSSTEGDKDNGL